MLGIIMPSLRGHITIKGHASIKTYTTQLSNLTLGSKLVHKIGGVNVGVTDFGGKVLYGEDNLMFTISGDLNLITDGYVDENRNQSVPYLPLSAALNTISLPVSGAFSFSEPLSVFGSPPKMGDFIKGYLNGETFPYSIPATSIGFLDRMWFFNSGLSLPGKIYLFGTNTHTIGTTYNSASLLYYWDIAEGKFKSKDGTDLTNWNTRPATLPLMNYSENIFPLWSVGQLGNTVDNTSAYYDHISFIHNGETGTYDILDDGYAYFIASPINSRPARMYIGRVRYNHASIIDPDAYRYWSGTDWVAKTSLANQTLNISGATNVLNKHENFNPLLMSPIYNHFTGTILVFISTITKETGLWGGLVHVYEGKTITGPYSYTGVNLAEDFDADHAMLEYVVPIQCKASTIDLIVQYYKGSVVPATPTSLLTKGYGGYQASMDWVLE